jgi:diguanylate cyclase (GGDEF)-like protein
MTVRENQIQVLSVEDDDVDYMTLDRALNNCGLDVSLDRAATLKEARAALRKANYTCLLLDYRLPDGSGLDVLKSECLSGHTRDMAIIMLTGEEDVSIAVEAMKCGADDYLPKKLVGPETLEIAIVKALESHALAKQVRDAQKKNEELAFFDSLTGLPNRHVFEDRLNQVVNIAKREKQAFFVGLLDLNGFKPINDVLGHQAGDIVLKTVASRLAGVIRESDTVARFGGDEFALLLPKAEPSYGVEIFSKRILDAIAEPISVGSETVVIGLSIGLSEFPRHGEDGELLMKRADGAMYHAKRNNLGWSMAKD